MALKMFGYKFIAFLLEPLDDQDGIDNFMSLQGYVLVRMSDDSYLGDVEDLLSTITLKKVREASIEFLLFKFYADVPWRK
jgi:hypothetical protein